MLILNPFHVLTVSPKQLPISKNRSVDSPPNMLEVYHQRKRQCPFPTSDQSVIHEHSTNEHLQSKQCVDIAYCFFSNLEEVDGHILPGWIGYNKLRNSTTISPLSKRGYLPVIDASPTRMDTVYTIFEQSVAIADSLELYSLDQAIYSKAEDLISISSGCVSPKDTRDHLIAAYSIGLNGAKAFVEDRMTSETDKIYNPIKTNKLKTFSIVGKTATARIRSETVSLNTSTNMFKCLLIIGKSRNIYLEELLSNAHVKAKLMHELEKDVLPLALIPVGSAFFR